MIMETKHEGRPLLVLEHLKYSLEDYLMEPGVILRDVLL